MELVVTVSHKSSYPKPIHFSPGDTLELGKRDHEYLGWIWVTTPSRNEGWAPKALIRRSTDRQGVALAEYSARELETQEGDQITCLRELNGWLWVENDQGATGWIPKSSVVAP